MCNMVLNAYQSTYFLSLRGSLGQLARYVLRWLPRLACSFQASKVTPVHRVFVALPSSLKVEPFYISPSLSDEIAFPLNSFSVLKCRGIGRKEGIKRC